MKIVVIGGAVKMLAMFWIDNFGCIENANGGYVAAEVFLDTRNEAAHDFVRGISEDDTGVPFPDAYAYAYTAEVTADRVLIDITIESPIGPWIHHIEEVQT